MLQSLYLKDFAIAGEVEFDLDAGMTVISGETGAGKSLLVDALMLLTGLRADAGSVRHGCPKAELSATFSLTDAPRAQQWLEAQEYTGDEEQSCQLRRVIRADGGSRSWINGRPATLTQLGDIGRKLVEIHGQHEHQALLDRGHQLRLVDAFAGHAELLASVADSSRQWQATARKLAQLPGGRDAQLRIEELERLLAQLNAESLAPDAIDEVVAAHRRQSNVAGLIEGCSRALDRLSGDDGSNLSRGLSQTRAELDRLKTHEPRLAEVVQLLELLQIQLDEAIAGLERINDDLDLDPSRLAQLEATLSRLHELGRRHRVPIEGLAECRQSLTDELTELQDADGLRERLTAEQATLEKTWQKHAKALSKSRREAAERLGAEVSIQMGRLGMSGGTLVMSIEERTDPAPDPLGAERVEFLVSANAGQPPRALRKVASGGELSRISLAIEVAAQGRDDVPSMVFDEVDSGIGGAVAEVVGRTLRSLAVGRQVLCVTHLPQVAACGHQHFRVSKTDRGGVTLSDIEPLKTSDRVEELARMLGGVEITAATRTHARQMLAHGQTD